MSNYASYFNQSSFSRQTQPPPPLPPPQQGQPAASGWTSTISSRFATFTKFLTRDSEEDDPEDEDCSHVSNVLRAYYTEKGRPFPPWLPPDPKKPQKQPATMAQGQYGQYGQYGGYDNQYGNQYTNPSHSRGASGGGGLSDLFSDSRQTQSPAAQSLRAPRPSAQTIRSYDNSGAPHPNDPYSLQPTQSNPGPRPLPSQRAGSFQNQNPPAASAAPITSRDRLKFRVGGGGGSGRNSPASNQPNQTYNEPRYRADTSGDPGVSNYNSASQSYVNTGSYDNYGASRDPRGYGNNAYQQRPSGPR